MAQIHRGRYAAEIDGDFVVFLIGARLNKPWRAISSFRDLGGRRRGMQAMLNHRIKYPENWHETYLVRAGDYEAIYSDLPEAGLATAGRAVPLRGASSARLRLRAGSSKEGAPARDG